MFGIKINTTGKAQREANRYAAALVNRAADNLAAGRDTLAAKLLCEASDYTNDQELLADIDSVLAQIRRAQRLS